MIQRAKGEKKMRYIGKFVAKVTIDIDVDANDPNIRPQKEIEKSLYVSQSGIYFRGLCLWWQGCLQTGV